jgi:dihydroorotate dehydrogenase
VTIAALKAGLGPRAAPPEEGLATEVAGLRLPVAIGLAAGFDKNAEAATALLKAGFGFVECGTVAPAPGWQPQTSAVSPPTG